MALGAAEVPELALRLFRSEEDVERALRRLERQGLAARSAGRAERWVAVPPDAALGTLLGRRRQELERAERAVAVLSDEYRNGVPRSATQDAVEIARGTTAIGHRSLQLLAAATEEVCALVPATERLPRGVPLRPGVRDRVVVERALLSRPAALGELAASLRHGYEAKVRVVNRLPTTLLAVDGHLALVALHRPCCATTPSRGPGATSEAYDGAPAEPRDEPYSAVYAGIHTGSYAGVCDEGRACAGRAARRWSSTPAGCSPRCSRSSRGSGGRPCRCGRRPRGPTGGAVARAVRRPGRDGPGHTVAAAGRVDRRQRRQATRPRAAHRAAPSEGADGAGGREDQAPARLARVRASLDIPPAPPGRRLRLCRRPARGGPSPRPAVPATAPPPDAPHAGARRRARARDRATRRRQAPTGPRTPRSATATGRRG